MATVSEILSDTDSRMRKSVESLKRELSTIRTGRATPTLVENLLVDYYGVPTPLSQLASISVPEARVVVIQPWDKSCMKDVEKGLFRSDLGMVPNNDGNVIRINISPLTEERRRELVKLVGGKVEESHVAARNIRRDTLERFREMARNKEMSEDESKRTQEQLQRLTDMYISQMDDVREEKEKEVMEV